MLGSGEFSCSCQWEINSKISLWYYQSHWNFSSVNWQNIIISNSYSTLHAYMVSADDKHQTGLCVNNNECRVLSYHQGKPGCWMGCLMKWWSCSITHSAYKQTVTFHLYSLDEPLLDKYIILQMHSHQLVHIGLWMLVLSICVHNTRKNT